VGPAEDGLDDVTITSSVNALVFDPNDNTRLWAATTMGIFESMDGGETWTKRMKGMKEVLMVITLALTQRAPTSCTRERAGGVYKSVDRARPE